MQLGMEIETILAIASSVVALAGAGIGTWQARLARRAANISDGQRQAAIDQANSAREAAQSAQASVDAAIAQLEIAREAADAARRQVEMMRASNQVNITVGLTHELRSAWFLECERYVLSRLRENDPILGQVQLPEPAGDRMQVVASLFNTVGLFAKFDVVDEQLAISIFGPRADRAWKVLEPYIDGERRIRNGDYMPGFEHFVALTRENGSEQVTTALNLKTVVRA
jgi:multidrug efflux pump subunit AcrA (membrane-fusion protein)